MTISLNLPPYIEELLHQRAERAVMDVKSFAIAMIAFGLDSNASASLEATEGI